MLKQYLSEMFIELEKTFSASITAKKKEKLSQKDQKKVITLLERFQSNHGIVFNGSWATNQLFGKLVDIIFFWCHFQTKFDVNA